MRAAGALRLFGRRRDGLLFHVCGSAWPRGGSAGYETPEEARDIGEALTATFAAAEGDVSSALFEELFCATEEKDGGCDKEEDKDCKEKVDYEGTVL